MVAGDPRGGPRRRGTRDEGENGFHAATGSSPSRRIMLTSARSSDCESRAVFEAARTVSSPNPSRARPPPTVRLARPRTRARRTPAASSSSARPAQWENCSSPGSGRSQRARSGRRGRHDPNRRELILRLCHPRLPLRHGAPGRSADIAPAPLRVAPTRPWLWRRRFYARFTHFARMTFIRRIH